MIKKWWLSILVSTVVLWWGYLVYQSFLVDTSLDIPWWSQTSSWSNDVWSLSTTGDAENTMDQQLAALQDGEPTSVSDWRDFPTRELTTTLVVDGLDAPWSFVFLPDERVLITERFGSLQLLADNGDIAAIQWVPTVFAWWQWWLLDVTIHPDFLENNYIYLSYAHGTEEWNRLRVARAILNDTQLESLEMIFEVAQTKNWSSHFGSRFQRLPDATLLFSVGDGGNPPLSYNGALIREQAQYLSAHLGKTIRINDDGSIPDDNPFIGRPDVRQEIYSYGHRNIQGIGYDSTRNRILASEHGSKWGDELNHILPWENYWRPEVSYSTEYDINGTPIADRQSRPAFVDPLAVWTPTIAPSEVVYYTGDRYDDWQWNVFLAAMLLRANNTLWAYASSPAWSLLRLMLDEQWAVIDQERLLLGDVRVRSVEQWPDGYLYVLTDSTWRQTRAGANAWSLVRIE